MLFHSIIQMIQIMRNTYLDLLKFMAIIIMILDHVGNYLLSQDLPVTHVIRGIGRLAMPLFFIVHGYLLVQRPDLPSFTRISKLFMYGSFLSIGLYIATDEFTLNILFQFALIELFWSKLVSVFTIDKKLLAGFEEQEKLYEVSRSFAEDFSIFLLYVFANLLLFIQFFYSLEQIIDYGIYPLFFAIAGLMFGFAHHHSDHKMENVSFMVLIATLSFQYNPILFLLYALYVDSSMIYYALPAVIIPVLVWYIPKANIELTVLRSSIAAVSRNALNIYVVHLAIFISISAYL